MWSRVQLDDIYRLRRVKKGSCLSAKSSPPGLLFLRESRDENPRVRYRAALSQRSEGVRLTA